MSTHDVSPLGPVDPASIGTLEEEKTAPWIIRKLVGSVTGRIVSSSYESLRAAGTSVVCLSPWGDSSPLLLPCIRFRDVAVHTVMVATGGVAAIAAPVMGPVSEAVFSAVGDTILVEIGLHTGFELSAKAADELITHRVEKHIPIHSKRLETTGVKTMVITLKYKHAFTEDANMGFFRSSIHTDPSLFSSVKDYLAIEKGWLSPYLFASGRRPIIPRTMTPDVVFCHTFLPGDYKIGTVLLEESAQTINLTHEPEPSTSDDPAVDHVGAPPPSSSFKLSIPKLPNLSSFTHMRSRTPSPTPELAAIPAPPAPRRILLLVLGIKPHRGGLWTTSARPGESVMQYQLLNGCPSIILPARVGTPVIGWDTLTLENIWKTVTLPEEGQEDQGTFAGVVQALFEYLDLCIEWERVVVPGEEEASKEPSKDDLEKRDVVRNALKVLVASAVKSGESKEVKKQVDKERSGIAMWRIV